MALCESQLDSVPQMKEEMEPEQDSGSKTESEGESSVDKKPELPNGTIFGVGQVPEQLPLSVDYRSPISHFIPPCVELYAKESNSQQASTGSSESSTPVKRKRGRPRVDKTSPEYLAKSAARKQAKEMAALNNSGESSEKRKRGRPRIDKTSPEYIARKKAKELEALEKKAKRQNKRRGTGDSAASSSAGETTPRAKRKYTKRGMGANPPGRPRKDKDGGSSSADRVKGKRGRPRKADLIAAGLLDPNSTTHNKQTTQHAKIRVRSNLMPINSEPITLDSDDDVDIGSPSQASDSFSLDENLRALRHLHEKYANLERDDAINAQLLPAHCKQPQSANAHAAGVTSSNHLETRVEKLEDSSNSDSDSSSSESDSSSSSSSSCSSGSSSSSSSSSSGAEEKQNGDTNTNTSASRLEDDRSFGAWSYKTNSQSDSESDSVTSRGDANDIAVLSDASLSCSENESPDKSFQCHICRKWYSTQVTLKIHRRGHQRRNNNGSATRARHRSSRYACPCGASFARRERLASHRAAGRCCAACGRQFREAAECQQHMAQHTEKELARGGGAHVCTVCGKRFSHAHSLTRHAQNHAKQLYRCVVCKASFARADQLAQHLNTHLANYKRLKP